MIEINSYIGSINIKMGRKFTLIHDYNEKIKDHRHIDGAIELIVDDLVLISQDQWDLVDQLWIYIINGIECILNKQDYTTHFPDSPIELSFKQTASPAKLKMIVGQKSVVYDTKELAKHLLIGAEKCLKEISRIITDPNLYQKELQKIYQIRVDLCISQ
jgi:hypothetical protein